MGDIVTMGKDARRRMGENGNKRVRESFTLEAFTRGLEEILLYLSK